ncbi:MAG: hypothetical protein EOO62_27660, partial [Hymenobacter sp.]
MKLLHQVLVSLLCGLPLAGAQAQVAANATPVAQGSLGTEIYLRDLPESLHPARTLPTGADNVALLVQTGNGNLANIAQVGDYNLAQLAVSGNGNTTNLTQQGAQNVTGVRLTGSNNPVDLTQRG